MPSTQAPLSPSTSVETIRLWNDATVPRMGLGTWAAGGMMIWPDGPSSYGSISRDDAIAGIRRGVEGSLKRLGRSSVDLVLLHHNELELDIARPVFDTLEAMRAEGMMTCYGWSSDHVSLVSAVTDYPGFKVVEHDLNVFDTASEMLTLVEERNLYSLARLPLAMGLLGGKYGRETTLGGTDVRASSAPWLKYFKAGAANEGYLATLGKIAPLLTADGRSLPQGALSWILSVSERTIPIPGFTTAAQIRDNIEAVRQEKLSTDAMGRLKEIVATA